MEHTGSAAKDIPAAFVCSAVPVWSPHLKQNPADSVRLCLVRPRYACFCLYDRFEISRPNRGVHVRAFSANGAYYALCWPLPCVQSASRRPQSLSRQRGRSPPGIAHPASRLCLSDLRRSVPCKNWALHLLACLPRCAASMRFLFVRPAFCLRLPSDRLTTDTLAVREHFPLLGM